MGQTDSCQRGGKGGMEEISPRAYMQICMAHGQTAVWWVEVGHGGGGEGWVEQGKRKKNGGHL